MKRLAIIGVGSSGIQALCHFLSYLDDSWQITSIHDPSIGILGIGESTNPSFVTSLEYGIDFNILENLDDLNATHKFGTKYKKWREYDFLNPLLSGAVAIHFDTFSLKQFAIPRMQQKWGSKFKIIEGKVTSTTQNDERVVLTVGSKDYEFDYVMDCSGFPKTYEDYTFMEDFTVNHGLVHNIEGGGDWKYTGHVATVDGWMFEIPLQTRKSFGYLFNDKITSVETAKENFSNQLNIPLEQLQNIEYKFRSYWTNKLIDGRIIKNGNNAIFFEPLFANSLFNYDKINRYAFDFMIHGIPSDVIQQMFNQTATSVRDMIAYQYHGGSIYDTQFWRETSLRCEEILKTSSIFQSAKTELIKIDKHKTYSCVEFGWVYGEKPLMVLDKNFGYNQYTIDKTNHFIL